MKLKSLESIFNALNVAHVRYLIAGGLAVNIHGYQRMTADLDLVLAMDDANLKKAIESLKALGDRPLVPVNIHEFEDPIKRQQWRENKNMEVFGLQSDSFADTSIDLFLVEPFDFEAEYNSSLVAELTPEIAIRVVDIPALIAMKSKAGRPRDLDDIDHLKMVQEEKDG